MSDKKKYIYVQWSEAMVSSMAGQPCKAAIYLPGHGLYPLRDRSQLGERIEGAKEDKMKKLHGELYHLYPGEPDESIPLIIACTSCEKQALRAIEKGPKQDPT